MSTRIDDPTLKVTAPTQLLHTLASTNAALRRLLDQVLAVAEKITGSGGTFEYPPHPTSVIGFSRSNLELAERLEGLLSVIDETVGFAPALEDGGEMIQVTPRLADSPRSIVSTVKVTDLQVGEVLCWRGDHLLIAKIFRTGRRVTLHFTGHGFPLSFGDDEEVDIVDPD